MGTRLSQTGVALISEVHNERKIFRSGKKVSFKKKGEKL
jgi:hypothetical protein